MKRKKDGRKDKGVERGIQRVDECREKKGKYTEESKGEMNRKERVN